MSFSLTWLLGSLYRASSPASGATFGTKGSILEPLWRFGERFGTLIGTQTPPKVTKKPSQNEVRILTHCSMDFGTYHANLLRETPPFRATHRVKQCACKFFPRRFTKANSPHECKVQPPMLEAMVFSGARKMKWMPCSQCQTSSK